jgi:hypothetical protein
MIDTDAKRFMPGSLAVIDSVTENLAGFGPGIPELSTWAMLGIGFAGFGLVGLTKRRKAPRYAL